MGNGKLEDTKILIDTDDKLPDYITLRNVLIIMPSIIKDDGNFICNYFKRQHCMGNKQSINACSIASYKMVRLALAKDDRKEQNQFLLTKKFV